MYSKPKSLDQHESSIGCDSLAMLTAELQHQDSTQLQCIVWAEGTCVHLTVIDRVLVVGAGALIVVICLCPLLHIVTAHTISLWHSMILLGGLHSQRCAVHGLLTGGSSNNDIPVCWSDTPSVLGSYKV